MKNIKKWYFACLCYTIFDSLASNLQCSLSLSHTHAHKNVQVQVYVYQLSRVRTATKQYRTKHVFLMQNTKFLLTPHFHLSVYTTNLAQSVVPKNLNPQRLNQLQKARIACHHSFTAHLKLPVISQQNNFVSHQICSPQKVSIYNKQGLTTNSLYNCTCEQRRVCFMLCNLHYHFY